MSGARDLLRPLAVVALIAFALGFVGYVTLASPTRAVAHEQASAAPTTDSISVSGAVSSGPSSAEWNLPHRI